MCILVALSFLVVSFNTKAKEKSDEEIGGEKEFKLDDNTRVDILLDDWACEIDWQSKWAEGIGQSIYYGLKTNRKPLVILLAKKDGWEKYRDRVEYCKIECWVYKKDGWEKYRDRVEYCKIECWVYDTRIRTWVDKE
jgi:hypothetical protein